MPDESAMCCIVIRGRLEAMWADYFGFLTASVQVRDGHVVSSTLSGFVPDFSAFIGVVTRLADSGVTILSAAYQHLPALA